MDRKEIGGHLALNGWTKDCFGNLLKELGARTREGRKVLLPHRLHFSDRVVRLERLHTYTSALKSEKLWRRIGSAEYKEIRIQRHPATGELMLAFGGSEGFNIRLARVASDASPQTAAAVTLANLLNKVNQK